MKKKEYMLKRILSLSTQKGDNLKSVYYIVANESGLTRTEIAERAGLRLSTCFRLTDELLESGLIYESGEAESRGGRKAIKLAISPKVNYLVGIDISRTYTKVLLLELNLTIAEEKSFVMNETSTPDVIIQKIIFTIYSMLKKQKLDVNSLLGIGVSAIGPLDTVKGMIINPQQFPASGWTDVPIVKLLKEEFASQVILDYGENTALKAENRLGIARSDRTVIHINKGIGIRLGLMINGEIIRSESKAGAFGQGHMVVDIHGKKCTCGNYGCMCAYSTIPALIKEVQFQLKRGANSLLQNRVEECSALTFSDIVRGLEEGDQLCKEVVRNAAYFSAAGLANLITIFQPSRVILSGPIYRKLDLFYKVSVEKAKERYSKLFPHLDVTFSQGALGEDATAIGSGSVVFESFFDKYK